MAESTRTTINLGKLKERIENMRSDNAWKALSLSKKVVLLLEEYLELLEQKAKPGTAKDSDSIEVKAKRGG